MHIREEAANVKAKTVCLSFKCIREGTEKPNPAPTLEGQVQKVL